jgi:hypothetical protein
MPEMDTMTTRRKNVRIVVGTIDSVTAEISRSSPWMRRTVRLETDAGPIVIEVGGEYDDIQFIIGSPAALPVRYGNGYGAGEQLWFAWNRDEDIDADGPRDVDGPLTVEYESLATENEVVAAESLREYGTVAA